MMLVAISNEQCLELRPLPLPLLELVDLPHLADSMDVVNSELIY
jgi:hypothetical protein